MTFPDYLRVLRRFLGLVTTCAVAGTLIALAFVAIPATRYRAQFTVTLAPHTTDAGTYGNLIDSLDRRSIPSTFTQVVTSPNVNDAAATAAHLRRGDFDVTAAVVGDSNVIEASVTGSNRVGVRDYAAALLASSTDNFAKLYPLYSVTALRTPTSSDALPRGLPEALLLGGLGGALSAYLVALVIDANRRARSRARIHPTPFAHARIGADLGTAPRPLWKSRPGHAAPR